MKNYYLYAQLIMSLSIVMRDVPADICDICGEDYMNVDVANNLYHLAESVRIFHTLNRNPHPHRYPLLLPPLLLRVFAHQQPSPI